MLKVEAESIQEKEIEGEDINESLGGKDTERIVRVLPKRSRLNSNG